MKESDFLIFKQLKNLINNSEKEILIIAPFIKVNALIKLLDQIDLQKITCVMRWLPDDIINGVSDLSVYEYLKSKDNARLYINDNLHAKYYRNETYGLIGSANITLKGLGLVPNCNIELLEKIEHIKKYVRFEEMLISQSILVNDEIYANYRVIYEDLLKISISNDGNNQILWFPQFNKPEFLYDIYSKQYFEPLTDNQKIALDHDLGMLGLINGDIIIPNKISFNLYIKSSLLNNPVFDYFISSIRKESHKERISYSINKKFKNMQDYQGYTSNDRLINWMIVYFKMKIRSNPNEEEFFYF